MSAATLSIADVARRLGRAPGWLTPARRAELTAEGFPPPLPCLGRPRWSAAAIDAWIAGTPLPAPQAADPWHFLLDARAASLAGA